MWPLLKKLPKKRRVWIDCTPITESQLNHLRGRLVYLASPYTSQVDAVQTDRAFITAEVTKHLMKNGVNVFSPIAYSHMIADALDYQGWIAFDMRVLAKCEMLAVLRLPGWDYSKGVRAEMTAADSIHMPIHFIDVEVKVED